MKIKSHGPLFGTVFGSRRECVQCDLILSLLLSFGRRALLAGMHLPSCPLPLSSFILCGFVSAVFPSERERERELVLLGGGGGGEGLKITW